MGIPSEYSKKADGIYTAFTVRPATPPKYKLFVYIGVFLVLVGGSVAIGALVTPRPAPETKQALVSTPLLTVTTNPRQPTGPGYLGLGLLLLALGCAAYWLGSTVDYRPRPHRVERTFRVSPDAVEVNGREFKRDDIHRLIVKNGMSGDRMLQSWGATPVLAETSSANISNIVQRTKNAAVCNSLDLETGGKAYMLAGGMDETTVNGLLHDVCRVLKFSKN